LATGLELGGVGPLVATGEGVGAGRWGWLKEPIALAELVDRVKRLLGIERVGVVGDLRRTVRTVAVACGAADELLEAARQLASDAMLLGEARFHTCLEAEAAGIGLILPGHFASERFGVEQLAAMVHRRFPDLEVWASVQERDPIQWT